MTNRFNFSAPNEPIWIHAAIAAALLAITVYVFAPIANHEFVGLDDISGILWNPDLRPESLGEAFHTAFTRPLEGGWMPLTMLSLQLDWHLYGADPTGYHVTNLILHALSTLLLYAALLRMTGATGASAFVAAVFAVHPLHVESVAWAIERKDVLSGFFFMATLLAYAHYVRRPISAGRNAGVLAALSLGLLAKPSLVTLPCVLLMIDAWPLRRLDLAALREKLPMFALVAASSYMTVRAQSISGAMEFGTSLSLGWRLANAVDAYVIYFVQTMWPAGLAAFYPHPLDTLSPAVVAAEALLLVAVTGLSLKYWRRSPYLLVGWLWFLGVLVPMIGLVQVGMQGRADRYMYLPMIGLSIALAFAAHEWAKGTRARRVCASLGVSVVIGLAVVASVQVATWRNSATLFQRMMDVHPDAAFPYMVLGLHHADLGNHKLADANLRRVLEIDPEVGRSVSAQLASLAAAQSKRGLREKAIRTAEQALAFAIITRDTKAEQAASASLSRLRGQGQ